MKIKQASILGMGAVGCTVAPGLQKVLGKENVFVIASGKRKEKLETEGRIINGKQYFFPVLEIEEKHPVDLIIVSVKSYQLEQAIQDIRYHVGDETIILSLMNGVVSERKIAEEYGWNCVLYSLTNISSQIRQGAAYYTLKAGVIKFGEEKNILPSPRVQAVAEVFEEAGIPYEIPEDMILAMWQKFIFNVSNNTVAAVLHARHFYFQRLEAANKAREIVLREAQAVALAKGIPITEEIIQDCMYYSDEYPAEGYCSMVQDVEAGRTTEKDTFLGDLIQMAEEEQLEVPVCRFLYQLLQAIEEAGEQGRKEHIR